MNALIQLIRSLISRSFGGGRVEIIGNNVPWTGVAYSFHAISNCTPTVMTIENGTGTFSGHHYSKGEILYGRFTAITLGANEYAWIYKD